MNKKSLIAPLVLALLAAGAAAAAGKDELPAVSPEGLVLQKGKVAKVLYVRPGVDFSKYGRFAILECPVAFRKDWQRDQMEQGKRVSDKDMADIQAALSAEFKKIFTDELQNKGGYAVVTEGAPDVLVIRPAIIDLDVAAPDTMSPGRGFTVTASAGAMTLYVELYDSVSSQILARAVDREDADNFGSFQVANRVTNMAEADRMLRRWASALRSRLDEVRAAAPAATPAPAPAAAPPASP